MNSIKIVSEFSSIKGSFATISVDLLPNLKKSDHCKTENHISRISMAYRRRSEKAPVSASMDDTLGNTIRALRLEDDEPITLEDDPSYQVFDANALSLLGCLLNLECQSMAKMIEYMPQACRVYDRVRGIALSRDRFQFVFQREEDLNTVLKDRPWSYNHWTMLLEKWVPQPPRDFLTKFRVWIRIRRIPVNYFTLKTMYRCAFAIGEVVEIAYDPNGSQTTDYIRALVVFDVSKPAKDMKLLNLSATKTVIIEYEYEYEKIHKRCFHCLRLTHEKASCPWLKKRYVGDGPSSQPRLAATTKKNEGSTSKEAPLAVEA